jgi:hypothetical protein
VRPITASSGAGRSSSSVHSSSSSIAPSSIPTFGASTAADFFSSSRAFAASSRRFLKTEKYTHAHRQTAFFQLSLFPLFPPRFLVTNDRGIFLDQKLPTGVATKAVGRSFFGIAPPLLEDTLLRLLQHLDHAASQLRHLSDLRVDHSPRVRREK